MHLVEGLPGAFLLHDRVVQLGRDPGFAGYSKLAFMCDGEGDWCPADSGGPPNECAFGADVATCGDELGPSWAGEDARARR